MNGVITTGVPEILEIHPEAIDRIRRENRRDDKQKEAQMVYDDDPPEPLVAWRRGLGSHRRREDGAG
jgi:hypothetical protein